MMTSVARLARHFIAAASVIAAATLFCQLTQANAVTAGFVYLIAVLMLAVWQGFVGGAIGSLLATACFNFFFFPPIGTFHIEDPENWVSLACFLIATTVASRLVVREQERTAEAERRRREIEALYNLCLDLFTAGAAPGGLNAAVARALRSIGVESGGLVLAQGGAGDVGAGSWIGAARDLEMHKLLQRGASPEDGARIGGSDWRNLRIPVAVGAHRVGELVAYGTRANRATLESVARLVALAVERERWLAEQARLEALQESDALKTALLRAVSHDLSTPLTAITILLQSLKRTTQHDPEGASTVRLIGEETARLHRRIENLLAMARLEAGGFAPRREPTPPADLFRAAREHLELVAAARRLEVQVAADCPDLDVDPSLVLEILVNLIENAHRSSPPLAVIELRAQPHPGDPTRVRLEVLDRGAGLVLAPPRLGEVSGVAAGNESSGRKGLGLEIARRFAEAHGGRVTLVAREGGGVCAQIDLPAALLVSSDLAGSR